MEHDERINRYLRNQMSDEERATFEQDVEQDEELRERLVATSLFVEGIAREGMRREGRAQLDAIKQMDEKDFMAAVTRTKQKQTNQFARLMKWASGIAAVAIVAFGFYAYNSSSPKLGSQMADVVESRPVIEKSVAAAPPKPSLASLADEYNRPFGNEPDEFVTIRERIRRGEGQDMLAVVEGIDRIEWPAFQEGPKGAADEDAIEESRSTYHDCAHWYKALAYLKSGKKEMAINELHELQKNCKTEALIERTLILLERLER